jgi:hypothetical protein
MFFYPIFFRHKEFMIELYRCESCCSIVCSPFTSYSHSRWIIGCVSLILHSEYVSITVHTYDSYGVVIRSINSERWTRLLSSMQSSWAIDTKSHFIICTAMKANWRDASCSLNPKNCNSLYIEFTVYFEQCADGNQLVVKCTIERFLFHMLYCFCIVNARFVNERGCNIEQASWRRNVIRTNIWNAIHDAQNIDIDYGCLSAKWQYASATSQSHCIWMYSVRRLRSVQREINE